METLRLITLNEWRWVDNILERKRVSQRFSPLLEFIVLSYQHVNVIFQSIQLDKAYKLVTHTLSLQPILIMYNTKSLSGVFDFSLSNLRGEKKESYQIS